MVNTYPIDRRNGDHRDRRADDRREGERRVLCDIERVGLERRHNLDFRVADRRLHMERRGAQA